MSPVYASEDEELDAFRKGCIAEVRSVARELKEFAQEVLPEMRVLRVVPHGSVLTLRFSDESDVDIRVEVADLTRPIGPSESLTERMREQMQHFPFSFGVADAMVVVVI